MRPSSPLLDSVRDQFEDYDQLAKDFTRVFLNIEPSCLQNSQLFDVVFMVGQSKQKTRLIGVRAILGVRSRVFQVTERYSIKLEKHHTQVIQLSIIRKCCMAFNLALVHLKCPSLSYCRVQHRLYSHRKYKAIVRKAPISCKFPTSSHHVRRASHHRRW